MSAPLTRGERVTLVIEEACRLWSVEKAELLAHHRFANLTAPRCAIVLALRELAPKALTYEVIGAHIGRHDCSSAVHLAARGRAFVRQSPGFAAALGRLCAIARGEAQ